jgi:hypothetical protein
LSQPPEVVEEGIDSGRETDTFVRLVSECCLQDRNADWHAAELAKELVPLLDLDPLLVWGDRIEDSQEVLDTVR